MSYLVTMPYLSSASRAWFFQATRWLLLLAAAVLLTGFFRPAYSASIDNFLLRNFAVGGNFTLTNQLGGKTSLSDLKGKVVLLSFGYTNCPDVCPTTLADMGKVLRSLGDRAQSVEVVFITVDPDRDTPERLKSYLANFHEKMIGLAGSVEELTDVAGAYSSLFRREEPTPGSGYSVGHTSFVFILNQEGKARYVLPYDVGAKMMLEGVNSLLDGKI